MRDYTNLGWPETPFGADQRPFARPSPMLAAFAVDWAASRPVCVATVYLRTSKARTLDVAEDTLNIGFRATVAETVDEVPELLDLLDRALVRARRHAVALAGHDLGADLARLATLVPGRRVRGADEVGAAWGDRASKGRGLAAMVDTCHDISSEAAVVDVELAPRLVSLPIDAAAAASAGLARCLAVGLTAAVHLGRYRWEGTFRVGDAAASVAWDQFDDGVPAAAAGAR